MRAVIINADDFGLTAGVNRGILQAFDQGVLSSTSLLANLPAFDDAIRLARATPELPVGVHLNLLAAAPVAGARAVPSLVDGGGRLVASVPALVGRLAFGRILREHLVVEFEAQIRKVLDAGIRPTHVDSHRHVHCLPGVFEATLIAAGRLGIRSVRLPLERAGLVGLRVLSRPGLTSRAKRALIGLLCWRGRTRLARGGFRAPDHFIGFSLGPRPDPEALADLLAALPPGVTEIACHPGFLDDALRLVSRIPPHREAELAALTSVRVREAIAANGLELTSHRVLMAGV